jgi:uncharacterized protein
MYIYSIYDNTMFDFSLYQQFEWDDWNVKKNEQKHRVTVSECEQVFSDPRKRIAFDTLHSSKTEKRFILIGKTSNERLLYIAFTARNKKIRVISARDLNRKERHLYL